MRTGMVFFACIPMAARWNLRLRLASSTCREPKWWPQFTNTIVSVIDLGLIMVAAWAVSTLKIARRTRYAVIFLFALGFLTVIACVGRTLAVSKIETSGDVSCKSPNNLP
jgi:hypothetical protein